MPLVWHSQIGQDLPDGAPAERGQPGNCAATSSPVLDSPVTGEGKAAPMSVLVPIGDFSRMTHLSVKTLRFYHDQGLLEPARIDPSSGYRFYDPGQVPVAQVIRRL